MDDLVRNEVKGMKRYIAGKPISEVKRELGLEKIVKMASNENPFGCSERVRESLLKTYLDVALYPDSSSYSVREALMNKYHRPIEEIFVGDGSDSLIKVIFSTFINKGDEIITGDHSFSRYEDNAKLSGAVIVRSNMSHLVYDLDDMKKCITEKTKIIFLCSPNNPTGSSIGRTEFEKLLQEVSENIIIVMDEAYREYVTREDYFDSLDYLDNHKNLIVLRTFSKAYGMASLRIGYGFASSEFVNYFYRVIDPFDVNLFAQEAAVEALKDQEFIKMVHNENKKGKEYFYEELSKMNLSYVLSDANFILFNSGENDMLLFERLMKMGYIIRPGTFLNLPGYIRVTISTMENNKGFIEALKTVLGEIENNRKLETLAADSLKPMR
ncbi:MAG: histidinol-phosphate transaminase [Clostridiaceae bacterium]